MFKNNNVKKYNQEMSKDWGIFTINGCVDSEIKIVYGYNLSQKGETPKSSVRIYVIARVGNFLITS